MHRLRADTCVRVFVRLAQISALNYQSCRERSALYAQRLASHVRARERNLTTPRRFSRRRRRHRLDGSDCHPSAGDQIDRHETRTTSTRCVQLERVSLRRPRNGRKKPVNGRHSLEQRPVNYVARTSPAHQRQSDALTS